MILENTAKNILEEMKLKQFKKFNEYDIKRLKREIEYVEKEIRKVKLLAEKDRINIHISVNFAVLKAYSERNKRIANAYRFYRIQKIMDNYFMNDPIIPMLCSEEVVFERKHRVLLDKYFSAFPNLDFHTSEPPIDFYVQIVTLEDCGIIVSGEQFIELKKGRLYFLRRKDVSVLLSKKKVEIVH